MFYIVTVCLFFVISNTCLDRTLSFVSDYDLDSYSGTCDDFYGRRAKYLRGKLSNIVSKPSIY